MRTIINRGEIVNLTQHPASREQKEAGVFDLPPEDLNVLKKLLTFDDLPTQVELEDRALSITRLAKCGTTKSGMIGGAPFLMPFLERAMKAVGILPLYAFSKRKVTYDEGGVKTSTFKHEGFVEAFIIFP